MQLQNPLWAFALKIYSDSDVQACCLALQNEYGMSVNRLLYAAWLATQHKLLDTPLLMQNPAQQWQSDMAQPLRALRYQVRSMRIHQAALDDVYVALKNAELQAERVELAYLYALAQPWPQEAVSAEILMAENLQRLVLADNVCAESVREVSVRQRDLLTSFGQYVLINSCS